METEMIQSNKETKVSTKKVFSGKQREKAIATRANQNTINKKNEVRIVYDCGGQFFV